MSAGRGPALVVLVVDDDADTRRMLRVALELAGHRVATAEMGLEAIDSAVELRPDVMLVDLGLPDMDGHEVARRVRAAAGEAIFLVALTGYGGVEDVEQSKVAGFDVHVVKPVSVDDLTRAIARRGPGL
jgi:CheY-like chemotaxis protein